MKWKIQSKNRIKQEKKRHAIKEEERRKGRGKQ